MEVSLPVVSALILPPARDHDEVAAVLDSLTAG
jgi:hypothetical protein